MKLKDLPSVERPRERLLKYGVESLSNSSLLSIILKTGNYKYSVSDISDNLLKEIENISNLKDITINKLIEIKGIGYAQAMTIVSCLELGKRIFYLDNSDKRIVLNNSKSIYEYIKFLLKDKKQEYFYCLYLNNKKELIERKLLFMGTVNKSIVHPREIFKHAYLCSASGIICIHNHPTGDSSPSYEDIVLTDNLVEIGRINGIPLIDHVIVSDNDYYSFYEDNRINNL